MASSRYLVIHVQSQHWIASYNTQTNEYKSSKAFCIYDGNGTNLFGQLQSMFNLKHIKAIAFTFIGNEFSTFNECYNFRRKCFEFCQKNQIFCSFLYTALLPASSAISITKTMVKEGEKVMVFLVDYPGMPPADIGFIRKANSYQLVSNKSNVKSGYAPFTKRWEEDIFQDLKPKKIIFVQGYGSNDLEKAQKFFKSYDSSVVTLTEVSVHYMDFVDQVLHLTGEKVNPYHIEVTFLGRFDVRYNGKTLIEATEFDILPFEKSVIVKVISKKSISLYCAFPLAKPPELVKEIKLSTFEVKKVKVTFKLDINSFYDFKVEPFNENQKEEIKENVVEKSCKAKPSKEIVVDSASDDPILPQKAQMVFDEQHFSVSYFTDGKEHIVNDSNGEAKTPIYIAFTEEKPIIGKSAMEMYSEKPKFVVFDLIKLCSVLTEDICNPKWEFKLSKEEETGDSLVLAFETFEGEKYSTVDFLLAFILKNGKERIKKETGKKFEEIEIKFDGFSPNEILKKKFIEAGKLLKTNILFV
uniref:Uncharacterized protein n=1 Tax=Panagrolaimus sp. PS1159 TaxID=55785 RepID=A0AC35GB80_9BILA